MKTLVPYPMNDYSGNLIQQFIIPAKAGIQAWMPFFNGMTIGVFNL